MRLIDLSHKIEHNMPIYPGDSKTNLYQERFLDTDKYNNHLLEINMHAGTHIDSPMHLTNSKEYIRASFRFVYSRRVHTQCKKTGCY